MSVDIAIDLLLLLIPLLAISLYFSIYRPERLGKGLALALPPRWSWPGKTMRRAGLLPLQWLAAYWALKLLPAIVAWMLLHEPALASLQPLRWALVALVFFAPDLWILARARQRQALIERQLGFFLDQLVGLLHCGLTLDAALRQAIEHGLPPNSPLRAELVLWQREIDGGLDRAEALDRLPERTGGAELRSLALVLKHAYTTGGTVIAVLQQHIDVLRMREREAGLKRINQKLMWAMVPLVLANFPLFLLLIFFTPFLELQQMFPQFGF